MAQPPNGLASRALRVGSLFSGIGGIELGLERAGCQTVWFVENNRFCQAVLRSHWPGIPIYDDVTSIPWDSLPRIDVLTGGFPCQDISNAGRRRGITGPYSGLWQDFETAIRTLKPGYVIIENVAALFARGLDTVVRDLQGLGYAVLGRIIAASDLGAPHRRERLYLVAYARTLGHQERLHDHLNKAVRPYQEWNPATTGPDWQATPSQLIAFLRARVWQAHPTGIRRVAHGVSPGLDRLAALGNAAIPQITQAIGAALQQTEQDRLTSR